MCIRDRFQAMLDIHTIVPFRVARALAPHWREAAKAELGEGREVFRKMVNISSVSGTMGTAGQANYSAAKAGVCLLYTSDAADDLTRVDLGGRRIIKKKKK